MEKRGVCSGEGEAPTEKAAEAKPCCGGKRSCGPDLASQMADAVPSGGTRGNTADTITLNR